jgi:hypothetical protein
MLDFPYNSPQHMVIGMSQQLTCFGHSSSLGTLGVRHKKWIYSS